MSPRELSYYRERAKEERARAAEAASEHASDIHLQMACIYEKLVELDRQRPKLTLVTSEPSSPSLPFETVVPRVALRSV